MRGLDPDDAMAEPVLLFGVWRVPTMRKLGEAAGLVRSSDVPMTVSKTEAIVPGTPREWADDVTLVIVEHIDAPSAIWWHSPAP